MRTPTHNRVILVGQVERTTVGDLDGDRRAFYFLLSTRKLRQSKDKNGAVVTAFDYHICTIYGDKVVSYAIKNIRKGCDMMVEGYIRYRENPMSDKLMDQRADIIVEYWQVTKEGDYNEPHNVMPKHTSATESTKRSHRKYDDYFKKREFEPDGYREEASSGEPRSKEEAALQEHDEEEEREAEG